MDTQLINEIKNDILALQAKLDEIIQRNSNDAIRLGPTEDGKVKVMAEHDLDIALTMYADHLIANYRSWGSGELSDRPAWFVTFERGRKFIKVVTESYGSKSVHSFICIQPDGKFQFGDILKAATWAQPAKNFARGNVLDPKSYVHHSWTGA
jgi:hypothetical protein